MTILLQRIKFKKRLMPVLFPILLAGCTNLLGSSFTNALKNDANASSDFYLNKVQQTQELEDKQTYKLLAARVLVKENKVAQAEALLAELVKLTPEQQLDKSLIEAHISAVKRDNANADSQLKMINLAQLSPSQTARYYEVAAQVAENRNDIIDAVKARARMDTHLSDIQRKQENNDRTWALFLALYAAKDGGHFYEYDAVSNSAISDLRSGMGDSYQTVTEDGFGTVSGGLNFRGF